MADVLRHPLMARVGKIRTPQVFDVPNLLLSTLAVVVAVAPFIPSDVSQPVRKLHVQQVEQQANRLLNLLTPNTGPPFYSVNFDNSRPLRRAQQDAQSVTPLLSSAPARPISERGPRKVGAVQDTNPPNLLLSVLTPFARAPFPSVLFDAPRPVRRGQVDSRSVSPLLFAPVAGPPPFAPLDWYQPRPVRRQTTDSVSIPLLLMPAAPAPLPFFSVDLTQPRTKRTPQVDSYSQVRADYTREPFIPVDGQQPRQLRRQVQDDPQYPFVLRTAAISVAPFVPMEFQQPRPVRRQTQGDDQQVSALLSAALPFTQQDFSQPRTKKLIQLQDVQIQIPDNAGPPIFPVDLQQIRAKRVVQVEVYGIQLPDFVGIPFAPYDGPQPSARRSKQDQQATNQLIFLQAPTPFYPIDFQQVRTRRAGQVDSIQSTVLTLPTDTLPARTSDTSQPRRVRAPQGDYSLNLLTTTLAPSAVVTPFVPYPDGQLRARRVPQVTGTDNPLAGPLWVAPSSPLPIGKSDHPQWRRHREVPDQYLLNTLLSTLAPTAAQMPFPPAQFPQIKPTRLIQSEYAYPIPFPLSGAQSPYKIDGQSSAHIGVAYGSLTLYNDGLGNYFSIAKV